MTAEIALTCDRCERRFAHFPSHLPGPARAMASDHGWRWRVTDNHEVEDICPDCSKEREEEVARG